jgi:acyl dehydratase
MDLSVVGYRMEPAVVSWNASRAVLYALGVGAGSDDPRLELAFTTDDSTTVRQAVLPTFPVVLGRRIDRPLGSYDRAMTLHAELEVSALTTLPPAGSATVVAGVESIHDKGSGALVTTRTTFTDPATGRPLAETRSRAFIRGEGGFGGSRGPSPTWVEPGREPDSVVVQRTAPAQALLYRLSGDRNPLHSDPAVAARAGFEQPILHGACTYGFAARALLRAVFDSEVDLFGAMRARFAAPVLPGALLRTSIWRQDDGASFVTRDEAGRTVLDRGSVTAR